MTKIYVPEQDEIGMEILIEGLEELAWNRQTQTDFWVTGNNVPKDEIHSFAEAICYVFDDSSLDFYMEKGRLIEFFSETICQKFEDLGNTLKKIDTYGVDQSPLEVVNNPNMDKVRELSGYILRCIKNQ